jgi:flagellum-specific peptidoglycan hydrolase FlgJ
VNTARKQRWQQATALVSLSTAGAMTGIAFAHGTFADMTSPTSMPAHLLAFSKPAAAASASDGALRSAIVSAAKYYLRLAQGKPPAQMEALIWQDASTDGADHGASCAAFASLTLEAGAQATGQQSWVTGGTSYPWPLHGWADVRVDPNPQSPGVISMLQDAESHHRWHPIGDGYTPKPGDWAMFAGHVEVVTNYSGGVLYTIGGDSMPNLSVNAHQYDGPPDAQGVTGFVNNGELLSAVNPVPAVAANAASPQGSTAADPSAKGQADIPGMVGLAGSGIVDGFAPGSQSGDASGAQPVLLGAAAIPGVQAMAGGSAGSASHRYSRSQAAPDAAQGPDASVKQAFIQEIAPGAIAAQRQYGVPAAVTIAQAIDESGWGQSQLATRDNNLFGIKGTGPAGSVTMPTQEYENGQWVTVDAPFRVYGSVAQSISDHTLLLATSSSYKQAMADRADPDAFANDLTGVYATDPNYGVNLITIMRLYNLYRYGAGTPAAPQAGAPGGSAPGPAAQSGTGQSGTGDTTGALGGGAQGVAGYGPGLGGLVGGAAGQNQALQGVSGMAAAIPGAAGTSAAVGSAGQSPAGSGVPRQAQPGTGGAGRAVVGAGAATRGGAGSSGAARHGAAGTGAAARRSATGTGAAARRSATGTGAAARRSATGTGAATRRSATGTGAAARPSSASAGGSVQRWAAADAASPGPPGLRRSGGRASAGAAQRGGARIPGLPSGFSGTAAQAGGGRALTAGPRNARISTRRYVPQIPQAVTTAFITTAKTPLLRSEPLYRDVASDMGVPWQLLAACDWMQCRAQPRLSPVYGEKLGTTNPDGTIYRTKSEALKQCARDLIILASAVYGIELTDPLHLSVRDLAKVFAAFRWGGLLAAHHVSAMEFPYSVAGLTAQHVKMRWPYIPETPGADKPGSRFPMTFGAVPIVLGLDYRAVA